MNGLLGRGGEVGGTDGKKAHGVWGMDVFTILCVVMASQVYIPHNLTNCILTNMNSLVYVCGTSIKL